MEYVNEDFLYSVRIPAGLIGTPSPPINHGFTIHLSDDDSDYLKAAADRGVFELSAAKPDYSLADPKGFSMLKSRTQKARLGRLAAVRIWQRLRRQSDGAVFVSDGITAIRGNGRIHYSLNLQTREQYYDKRVRLFDALLASFRLLPCPDQNPAASGAP